MHVFTFIIIAYLSTTVPIFPQKNDKPKSEKKYDFTIKYKAGFNYVRHETTTFEKKVILNGKEIKTEKLETERKDKLTVISLHSNGLPKKIKNETTQRE